MVKETNGKEKLFYDIEEPIGGQRESLEDLNCFPFTNDAHENVQKHHIAQRNAQLRYEHEQKVRKIEKRRENIKDFFRATAFVLAFAVSLFSAGRARETLDAREVNPYTQEVTYAGKSSFGEGYRYFVNKRLKELPKNVENNLNDFFDFIENRSQGHGRD